jgi:hypothetical protein
VGRPLTPGRCKDRGEREVRTVARIMATVKTVVKLGPSLL